MFTGVADILEDVMQVSRGVGEVGRPRSSLILTSELGLCSRDHWECSFWPISCREDTNSIPFSIANFYYRFVSLKSTKEAILSESSVLGVCLTNTCLRWRRPFTKKTRRRKILKRQLLMRKVVTTTTSKLRLHITQSQLARALLLRWENLLYQSWHHVPLLMA